MIETLGWTPAQGRAWLATLICLSVAVAACRGTVVNPLTDAAAIDGATADGQLPADAGAADAGAADAGAADAGGTTSPDGGSGYGDLPWAGAFLGFPLGGGQNNPMKVGGQADTSMSGKYDDNRLGLRIAATRSGTVLGIALRTRVNDPDKCIASGDAPGTDKCYGGCSGTYCPSEGEYSVGDGGNIVGTVNANGGTDPSAWEPGAELATIAANGGLSGTALVDYVLDTADYVYWELSAPLHITGGSVYYVELRQSPEGVDDYLSYNQTWIKQDGSNFPLSDSTRAGPLQTNWEICASREGTSSWSINTGAIPSYMLLFDLGAEQRMLVGAAQVYAEDTPSSFVVGGSQRYQVEMKVHAPATLNQLWLQVDGFIGGTPSGPLQADVHVNGDLLSSASFPAATFTRSYQWASLSLPSTAVTPDDTVTVTLSSSDQKWGIRRFDLGKWYRGLDARTGLTSPAAVETAMRDADIGILYQSSNGGSSWTAVGDAQLPVAIEVTPGS